METTTKKRIGIRVSKEEARIINLSKQYANQLGLTKPTFIILLMQAFLQNKIPITMLNPSLDDEPPAHGSEKTIYLQINGSKQEAIYKAFSEDSEKNNLRIGNLLSTLMHLLGKNMENIQLEINFRKGKGDSK